MRTPHSRWRNTYDYIMIITVVHENIHAIQRIHSKTLYMPAAAVAMLGAMLEACLLSAHNLNASHYPRRKLPGFLSLQGHSSSLSLVLARISGEESDPLNNSCAAAWSLSHVCRRSFLILPFLG